jgi:hypothetical protein
MEDQEMPYWLYELVPEKGTYKQQKQIAIFGSKEGLIYHAIKAELPRALERKMGFSWVRTASELLSGTGYDSNRHAVLIDIAPDRKGEILLGVIGGIAGHTDETWTQLLVLLDVIDKEGPAEAKLELNLEEVGRDRSCDVLYARGGWGEKFRGFNAQPRGGITGALLGPLTFKHLAKSGLEWIENGKVSSETQEDGILPSSDHV